MLFTLLIQDYYLEVIIGILDFERKQSQKILLNAEISYEYNEKFLDYVEIKDFITKLLESKKYNLLEEALIDISNSLKDKFNLIKTISLEIKKIGILQDCIVGVKLKYNF